MGIGLEIFPQTGKWGWGKISPLPHSGIESHPHHCPYPHWGRRFFPIRGGGPAGTEIPYPLPSLTTTISWSSGNKSATLKHNSTNQITLVQQTNLGKNCHSLYMYQICTSINAMDIEQRSTFCHSLINNESIVTKLRAWELADVIG